MPPHDDTKYDHISFLSLLLFPVLIDKATTWLNLPDRLALYVRLCGLARVRFRFHTKVRKEEGVASSTQAQGTRDSQIHQRARKAHIRDSKGESC